MSPQPAPHLERIVYWLSRLVLGVIFIYAACRKLGAPEELADNIASYHLLPHPLITPMALGLPPFEFMCGLLLLTRYFCTTGLLGCILMLALFLAAIFSAIVRGIPIDCGCFGAHSWLDINPWVALVRDSVLLFGAVYAYRYDFKHNAQPEGGTREVQQSVCP